MINEFKKMSAELILRKKKSLIRELETKENLKTLNVAILGGSTTQEFTDLIEILLLIEGFRPNFYQGEYNRYFEETVVDSGLLKAFSPDIVIIYTSSLCIVNYPELNSDAENFVKCLNSEFGRFSQIWDAITASTNALILQNNFEPPQHMALGNAEGLSNAGHLRFCRALNERFARELDIRKNLLIIDQVAVCESIGKFRFLDNRRWFNYKIYTTPEGSLELARTVTGIFRAIYGHSKKCLILDLDNTIWGGVIGDDGPERIIIGRETPRAEAYTAFQEYCLRLNARGIILAVCSKNDESIALMGLDHPDSVLRRTHFGVIKANWLPKHENIIAIANELNIGLESIVFVDDNPAERHIVKSQIPEVAVPDVGSEVEDYVKIIEEHRWFEITSLVAEDLSKAAQYNQNAQRIEKIALYETYGDYLDSLEMKAEISPWKEIYLERISQLCNKTNQFNLTTQRYTLAEIQSIHNNKNYITIYGKLNDIFGDNGLVSLVFGFQHDSALIIETWLMSCRVLKRDMELAMLDALVVLCREREICKIIGKYVPSGKNILVSDLYEKLGFELIDKQPDGSSNWKLDINENYLIKNTHIKEI